MSWYWLLIATGVIAVFIVAAILTVRYWTMLTEMIHGTAPRIIAGTCVLALYFLAASWLKTTDPVVIRPQIEGKIVPLHKPFASHGTAVIAPDYWFGAIADSATDRCRSTGMV